MSCETCTILAHHLFRFQHYIFVLYNNTAAISDEAGYPAEQQIRDVIIILYYNVII